MMFGKKRKSNEAMSEVTSDTGSDSLGENDSDSAENSPEMPEGEAVDQRSPKGESAASKDDTSSENEQVTNSDSQVENNSDGGENSSEENEPPALWTNSIAEVNQNVAELRKLFAEKIARNQSQIEMFNAIHREMKDYKENLLLEAFHEPVIHNLISLYDNFKLTESQLNDILNGTGICSDDLSQFQNNLKNVGLELEEVLFRLDVSPYEERLETWDRKLHKTCGTKPTDTPEQDGEVAEVHKIGFYWRNKVFRPEEVTIFRYTPSPTEKGEGKDE